MVTVVVPGPPEEDPPLSRGPEELPPPPPPPLLPPPVVLVGMSPVVPVSVSVPMLAVAALTNFLLVTSALVTV